MNTGFRKKPVVLAVSSGGGHWVQMRHLAPAFEGADVHYATTDKTAGFGLSKGTVHFYPDANKTTPLRLIACVIRMICIISVVRPDVVISTGAAGGFVAIRIARFFGAKTMFIDSIANVKQLSISARLSVGIADRVLSQWPKVAATTGTEYKGAII